MATVVCAGLLFSAVLLLSSAGVVLAGKLTPAQRQEFIDVHNTYRRDVTPTATDMTKMSWSYDLEEMASGWAEGCQYKHGQPTCDVTASSTGQNLFASTNVRTPTAAVQAWYNEVNDYDYDGNKCGAGKVCGHYTQVVWAGSLEVGCAMATCGDLVGTGWPNGGFYVVCNYKPPGNYVGQKPYAQGDSCTACGDKTCVNKLCVDSSLNYTVADPAPSASISCGGAADGGTTDGSTDTGGSMDADSTTRAEEGTDSALLLLPSATLLALSAALALWTH